MNYISLVGSSEPLGKKAMAIFEYDENSQGISFEVTSELGKEVTNINR